MTFLNQSTCARQWSKAWINSCVTTRFIWDCWRMLFWHRTICRRKDTGSLITKFQHLPCFSETQHTSPTAFRLFRSLFFNINSLIILQCTSSNTMEHPLFILFSWLSQISALANLILVTKCWRKTRSFEGQCPMPTWDVAESKPPLTQPSQFSQEKCRSLKTVLKGPNKPSYKEESEKDQLLCITVMLLHRTRWISLHTNQIAS